MSRGSCTARQSQDFCYGQVCTLDGTPMPRWLVSSANQEHSSVPCDGAPDAAIAARSPIGTRLHILPNHACATGEQFPQYRAGRGRHGAGLGPLPRLVR